jgi:PIN domain nuclease of toxin-antitoxin system
VAVLLDTHILLEMVGWGKAAEGEWGDAVIHVSVASLWEVAIKARQGKLQTLFPLAGSGQRVEDLGWVLLPVTAAQAVAEVDPRPNTNDPFDRLLLAVCSVDGLKLVTRDHKLRDHPLAWRPAPA